MSRSNDFVSSNQPHGNGWRFFGAHRLAPQVSANLVLTRNAVGDYSLNRTAAGAETYTIVAGLADMLQRQPNSTFDYHFAMQEQFGGANSPAPPPGRPPMTAAQMALPAAGPVPNPKGIRLKDIVLVYQVGVAALTSLAMTLQSTVLAEAVAPVVTGIPLTAPTIPLTTQATPHLITVPVTTPVFVYTDLTEVTAEVTIVLANTGTLRVYGIGAHFDFNLL